MPRQSHLVLAAMVCRLLIACGDSNEHPAPIVETLELTTPSTEPADEDELAAPDNLGVLVSPLSSVTRISPKSHKELCLDAVDGSQESGTKIQLWECHEGENQQFRLAGTQLRVFDDKCVAVASARNEDGTSVRIKPCDSSKMSQAWHQDGDTYRWANTDKCLDVTDGEFQNGTLLQIWTCNKSNENQLFAATSSSSGSASPSPAPAAKGTRFDLSKWHQETYAAGTFNHEQERYTNNNRNVSFAADGTATIVAKKVNGEWTSARLTGDVVGTLPAYYEATITCPKGKGTWPAFWLTSRGAWPQGGEIDIMEQINGNGQTHWSNHWGASSGKPTFNTHESTGGLDLSKPHRYGGYITKDGVQFYLDGKAVGKHVAYPAASNFPKIASQMVPIVNLAMGGDWPGSVPSSTGEQTMIVHSIIKAATPP